MAVPSVSISPRAWLTALTLAIVAAACTSGTDADLTAETPAEIANDADGVDAAEVFPGPVAVRVASTNLNAVGEQRVVLALQTEGSPGFLGDEDHPIVVTYQAISGTESFEREGTWLSTSGLELGVYISYFDFPEAGQWEFSVSEPDGDRLGAVLFNVPEASPVPSIGEPLPALLTPTAATPDEIANISTDLDPDPRLYELSIADAVSNDRPTVVAIATPAFCQTRQCGPTLDFVKAATAGRTDIDVVHVEPFDLSLAPQGILDPVQAMLDFGVQTEPWVFVADADGIVTASFEGIIGQAEIEAAIDRLP